MQPRCASLTAMLAGSLLTLTVSRLARADALPPPQDCPSGQVWVDSHSGGCTDVAPTNCPPAWRGIMGGLCVVAVADQRGACPGGSVAKPVTLCFEKRLDHGSGRVRNEPPLELEVPVGILGPGVTCAGTDTVRFERVGNVCLGKDETPFAFVTTGPGARGPRGAEATSGGCSRGCGGGDDAGNAAAMAVAGLALAWRARRVARSRLSGAAGRRWHGRQRSDPADGA